MLTNALHEGPAQIDDRVQTILAVECPQQHSVRYLDVATLWMNQAKLVPTHTREASLTLDEKNAAKSQHGCVVDEGGPRIL